MKTVIQRVKSASVTVDGQLISTISKGILVFAAVGKDDSHKEAESMAAKLLKVKLWEDETGKKWAKNVQEIDGEVLCVSQFTLLATTKKGNKPDFHASAPAAKGKELYDSFIGKVRSLYREDRVKDGIFQAMMDVGLVNDGPVGAQDGDDSDPPPPASPASPASPTSPSAEPTLPLQALPPIGVDYSAVDEVVTIEIETNPPPMKNPTSLPELDDLQLGGPEDGDSVKGNVHKRFDLPASLLE